MNANDGEYVSTSPGSESQYSVSTGVKPDVEGPLDIAQDSIPEKSICPNQEKSGASPGVVPADSRGFFQSRKRRNGVLLLLLVVVIIFIAVALSVSLSLRDSPPKMVQAPFAASHPWVMSVSLDGILKHERMFQAIADQYNGTRYVGTPGYAASISYVFGLLKTAGYRVTIQDFILSVFEELGPSKLQTPDKVYTYKEDFMPMDHSPRGNVTATPQFVYGLGCNLEDDFRDFAQGNIAIIERGTCTFEYKALHAQIAGAVGVVIFNNDGGDVFLGSVGVRGFISIPVFGTSHRVGLELLNSTSISMFSNTGLKPMPSFNVLAETTRGNPEQVIIAGAHLDSVLESPGINDNGSGSSVLLEVALAIAGLEPTNMIRFAWWGAEEIGLRGSEHYVNTLPQSEKDKIALYLNLDMVGSPNYARFVMADDPPTESNAISQVFFDFFTSKNLHSEPWDLWCGTDTCHFKNNGIPCGGLHTGAGGPMSAEQAMKYGGLAGVNYDPCYHQACDDINNLNETALDEMSNAFAHTLLGFANLTTIDLRIHDSVRRRRDSVRESRLESPEHYRGTLLVM